jgi:hypothetical protein
LTKGSISFTIFARKNPEGRVKKMEQDIRKMEDEEVLEELKEDGEEMETYVDYVSRLRAHGAELLRRHMYRLCVYIDEVKVDGASPFSKRALNYNDGSAPTVILRVYCGECKKVRTLLVFPSKSSVELRASCVHVLSATREAALKDSTLVCVGEYKIIPAGIAKMLGLRIVG